VTETLTTQLLVLGAGPGGYTAAFRAADLGQDVVLVDQRASLGGVCLNVGCIPSKALLHAAKVLNDAEAMKEHGLAFAAPVLDLDALRGWKDGIVTRLTGGLAGLAATRRVRTVRGHGRFVSAHELVVDDGTVVRFEQAIIACGSEPVALPFLPWEDPRVLDSTTALELGSVPATLLVLGGGVIGLEMATVYAALGSTVTVVEMGTQLIPGADPDVVAPLHRHLGTSCDAIHLGTQVTAVEATPDGLLVSLSGPDAPPVLRVDALLSAVGRRASGHQVAAQAAGVHVNPDGTISVDEQLRTGVPHVFAVGDVVGQPMLAHKASHQAKVAAEVAAGLPSTFRPLCIPSVAYTDPEVAWAGLTETDAARSGTAYDKAVFPWAASGRALSQGRDDGFTKLLFDPDTKRLLGCAIVGPGAGELLAEAVLGIETGADALDLGLSIHPHPTLSETLGLAAEVLEGTVTDLPPSRRSARV
jgi:dihydrolipoamide dehydrogenase